jgi:hypothetical protein
MRKIYCDCCKREILSVEQLFSMEIKKGQDMEIVLKDMCANCYERIMQVINNAEMWMLSDKSSVL